MIRKAMPVQNGPFSEKPYNDGDDGGGEEEEQDLHDEQEMMSPITMRAGETIRSEMTETSQAIPQSSVY
jgi:hypothetical protein